VLSQFKNLLAELSISQSSLAEGNRRTYLIVSRIHLQDWGWGHAAGAGLDTSRDSEISAPVDGQPRAVWLRNSNRALPLLCGSWILYSTSIGKVSIDATVLRVMDTPHDGCSCAAMNIRRVSMVIVNSCNCISEASRTPYVDHMVISNFKKKACRGGSVRG
jgi:hypothetical protein